MQTPLSDFRYALVWLTVAAAGTSTSAALACVPPPPASPEVTAAKTLTYQRELWVRAETVFIARVAEQGRVEEPGLGNWAKLIPVVILKGNPPKKPIRIQHTGMSSCGLYPFHPALASKPNAFYVVYSSKMTPTWDSILTTLKLSELVEPSALSAWRQATPQS